ncbi:hypothetical protein ACFPVY_07230 [Flavobacterium qiangtangense]|uniref:Uncharacterized protein n=1 Tax=Flavobacterium qiangtangense TaxID=1442595 RepID=A0ABW1PMS3_9FLAO
MKLKFTALLLLAAISLQAQFVKNHGRLSVNGTQLVDKNGDNI